MAGATFTLAYPQGAAWNTSAFHFFFKAGGTPASDMTLVDLNAGASGYNRIKLRNSLHVYLEYSFPHNTVSTTESWDISGVAVGVGVWYWVGVGNTADGQNFRYRFYGDVRGPGGTSLAGGAQGQPSGIGFWDSTGDPHGINFTVQVGLGVSLSSSYLPFPNTIGWEMGKFQLYRGGFGMPSMPVSDPSGGDVLYLGRQTVGSAIQLNDSSGNSANAAAGTQGLSINADGPYA